MFGDRGHSYLTGVVIEDGDGDDFYDIGEGIGGVRVTAWNGTRTFATETWAAGGYSLGCPTAPGRCGSRAAGSTAPITRHGHHRRAEREARRHRGRGP
jgi:hypothetical protein